MEDYTWRAGEHNRRSTPATHFGAWMHILIFDLDDTLIADVAAAHTATAATLAASDAPADDETVAAALRISRKMWKASWCTGARTTTARRSWPRPC
ncbi:hypothetical protein, partial [Actinoplanes philippinensis]|uniref:hypothetical protein n=1 Tax=Actinoplanes philippinensis TaxID=35752 RepID=UPI0033D31A1F